MYTYYYDQDSKTLSFYIKPEVTNYSENIINTKFEVMVTNGAVGDVRIIDYRNDEIKDVANNVGGTIRKDSDEKGRTFEFEISYVNQKKDFLITEYVLVSGKDGSKHLGMILYHVKPQEKVITSKYFSTQDLIFTNKDEYSNVLSDYQKLVDILREKGEL